MGFGETGFFPAERAEHLVLGWERALTDGITLGIDAYQRRFAPDGQLVIVSNEEEWLGMIPSFGIGWEF